MKNLWQSGSIWCLAPMEGVTDSGFRRVIRKINRPHPIPLLDKERESEGEVVVFTEFVNVEGMNSVGREAVEKRLKFTSVERPIVAQIWGLEPENYKKAAKRIVELGFDGVDINFGCPEKKVVAIGAGAAYIKDNVKAGEIIKAVKEGVGGKIPVSVKTRIGYSQIETEDWCGFLLDQGLDALIVHGRTKKEMSKVGAHWDEIGKVVRLRDEKKLKTKIIGNGDIESLEQGNEMIKKYGVDGIMVGRWVFKNPWLFNGKNFVEKSKKEKLDLLKLHLKLWDEERAFDEIKKYFKIYIREFPEAGELREELMKCQNIDEVRRRIV